MRFGSDLPKPTKSKTTDLNSLMANTCNECKRSRFESEFKSKRLMTSLINKQNDNERTVRIQSGNEFPL